MHIWGGRAGLPELRKTVSKRLSEQGLEMRVFLRKERGWAAYLSVSKSYTVFFAPHLGHIGELRVSPQTYMKLLEENIGKSFVKS